MDIEDIGSLVLTAAIKVHRTLGPGLLESAYQKCLEYELKKASLRVECEVVLPIQYETVRLDAGYRLDMLVEGRVIIENKTVEKLLPIHTAQLLTYLKMKNCSLGYLFNWNSSLLKDDFKRLVNGL